MAWEKEIEVCRRVARKAGKLAMEHPARGVEGEDDDSPETEAGRACEQLIIAELGRAFPEDGLLGEEGANDPGWSGRRWIIDPIDGTRDLLRGLPDWGTLIALEADGEIVLGVCNLFGRREMYWAVRGGGAWMNGTPIRVSSVDRRERAVLTLTDFGDLAASPLAAGMLEYMAGYQAVRSLGRCHDAVLVAAGRVEASIGLHAEAWDLAPLAILTEEAGGCFFNFDGGRSIHGGNAVFCAPLFEEELRALVRPAG